MNPRIRPAIVSQHTSVYEAMEVIKNSPVHGGPSGIALVVSGEGILQGILTDGDIREIVLQHQDLDQPVSRFMNRQPIVVSRDLKGVEIVHELTRQLKHRGGGEKERRPTSINELTKIIVVDGDAIVDMISPLDLLKANDPIFRHVCVVGLGYVGITLAAVLVDEGFHVTGIEHSAEVRAHLDQLRAPFFENGLDPLLRRYYRHRLHVEPTLNSSDHDIYVVTVGTPINEKHVPQMAELREALKEIGAVLKRGDLVILRSTIPPGTSREMAIPILEKRSGLRAGHDFHYVFAPERTVEGKALHELRSIPQIIGGYTQECVNDAANFFGVFVPTIVRVESLETAEVAKLINNSFRDVCFGYSNQIAMLCEELNVDTVAAINAANEGYARNPVPVPSPGVGGSCLKKDPFILLDTASGHGVDLSLVGEGRRANEHMIEFVGNKVMAFCEEHGLGFDSRIFILGVAFKGEPETSDIRNSTALDLIGFLRASGFTNIVVYDPIVSSENLKEADLRPVESIEAGFGGAHAVLFMNNHRSFLRLSISQLIELMNRPVLFFDGWHQFQRHEIESISGVHYHGLGTCRVDRYSG